MGAHRLVMSPRAIKMEETQRQITRIYNDRGALSHDDRVDALAATIEYFEDHLGVDVDKAMQAAQEAREEEQWRTFMNDKERGISLLGDRASGAVRLRDDRFSRGIARSAENGFFGRSKGRFGR